ncbi:lactonase family protein [Paenibacillus xylaniclasticus]|uniref:lactonase family protein n=1 Tax=Paenibacillus xylaniclasticus TaxID=588083 RepID=UPI000FDA2FAE|nr:MULTISPECIES: lactonase family protein [Paenibacillus]GFN32166.1 6-phosphogluconolactonase [Paenibacillus curdlanolyticus]
MQHMNKVLLWAGSYNTANNNGIRALAFDTETGILSEGEGLTCVDNPSFLAYVKEADRLFAVSETSNGAIVAFGREGEALAETNRQSSNGDDPCHLTIDESGQWLLLVNYSGGPVSVYPIAKDGSIGPASDTIKHEGSSVNPNRQECSHPHSIYAVPGTALYLVNDLGTDTIYTYRLDRKEGKLALLHETKAAPGAGPRHLAFHPTLSLVYVIEELSNTISVYELDRAEGLLTHRQTVPALPADFDGFNLCAEIAVSEDGRYVYGSNRGHDSIVSFRVGEEGLLELIGHTPSGGKAPRHFLLVPGGRWLLTANQDSDRIAVLSIGEDGYPALTEQGYDMVKPVCIRLR